MSRDHQGPLTCAVWPRAGAAASCARRVTACRQHKGVAVCRTESRKLDRNGQTMRRPADADFAKHWHIMQPVRGRSLDLPPQHHQISEFFNLLQGVLDSEPTLKYSIWRLARFLYVQLLTGDCYRLNHQPSPSSPDKFLRVLVLGWPRRAHSDVGREGARLGHNILWWGGTE